MADKRCENGHFIDESWDLCPYCPAENAESDIPIVRPTRGPYTETLAYAFPTATKEAAVLRLAWGDVVVDVPVRPR